MDKEIDNSSVFNMAIATLMRIDDLLKSLHFLFIKDGLPFIRETILELYKELYPFLNKQEIKIGDKKLKKIFSYKLIHSEYTGYQFSKDFRPSLHDFDFWIRKKLKDKGLLMNVPDDPKIALGR